MIYLRWLIFYGRNWRAMRRLGVSFWSATVSDATSDK